MGDTYTMDEAAVVRDIQELVGELTDDEAALVRTLTPADRRRRPGSSTCSTSSTC